MLIKYIHDIDEKNVDFQQHKEHNLLCKSIQHGLQTNY